MGKDDDDEIDKDVRGWLNSQEIDATSDYLKRGRHLAELSEDELTARYAQTSKDADEYMRNRDVREECSDCRAEFALRGTEPPASPEIKADFAKIQIAIKSMMERMSKEAYEDFAAEVADDLDEYRNQRDREKN